MGGWFSLKLKRKEVKAPFHIVVLVVWLFVEYLLLDFFE